MNFYVGTSGWAYDWNEKRRLEWFVNNSGLNAIELNASFYRFPSTKAVGNWAKKGKKFRWAIKVNRLVTHTYKFNPVAIERWSTFFRLFEPLNKEIDFFLFQLPPQITPHSAQLIEKFFSIAKLGSRFALEVRNNEWFSQEWVDWAKKLGLTLVSVDAPDLPRNVFNVNGLVYVRMHGRTGWYSHRYSSSELEEVKQKILRTNPTKAYVFFNNNHAMLDNGREMLEILNTTPIRPKAVKQTIHDK